MLDQAASTHSKHSMGNRKMVKLMENREKHQKVKYKELPLIFLRKPIRKFIDIKTTKNPKINVLN